MNRVLRSVKNIQNEEIAFSVKSNTRSKSLLPSKLLNSPIQPPRRSLVSKNSSTVDPKVFPESSVKSNSNDNNDANEFYIVGRSAEISNLSEVLSFHVKNSKSASVYVSGAPGTGKTVVVDHVIQRSLDVKYSDVVFVNCMNLVSSYEIYSRILQSLNHTCSSRVTCLASSVEGILNRMYTSRNLVLVLDEIDQLSTRSQDILYRIFDWPAKLTCCIIIIGIANALDLPERLLPRIRAKKHKPIHIVFRPYSQTELIDIISARLSSVNGTIASIQPLAVQLCARKIAASTGDVRKALDVCRRALDLALLEGGLKEQITGDLTCSKTVQVIPTIQHVSLALRESQFNAAQAFLKSSANADNFVNAELPLHHKLLLASCMLLRRQKNLRELPFGQLFDTYSLICDRRKVNGLDESELVSVCQLLDSNGLIEFHTRTQSHQKLGTPARMRCVKLRLDDHGVGQALHDDLLLSAIMDLKLT